MDAADQGGMVIALIEIDKNQIHSIAPSYCRELQVASGEVYIVK